MPLPTPAVIDLLDAHALNEHDGALRSVSELGDQLETLALDLAELARDDLTTSRDSVSAFRVRAAAITFAAACRDYCESIR